MTRRDSWVARRHGPYVEVSSPSELYYHAIAVRQGVADAAQWLRVNWAVGEHGPTRLASLRYGNAVVIVDLMERNYPGGYRAFLAFTSNLREGV